jgi:hypothetical protein
MFKIELSDYEGWYLLQAIRHESQQLERLANKVRDIRENDKGRLDGRMSLNIRDEYHASTDIAGLLQQHFEDEASKQPSWLPSQD